METKDVILQLRKQRGLSQDELAEKVFVTRQAVSRWETGETIPNTETLKLLSNLFGVSINRLLGGNNHLICKCCGMPLDETTFSHEKDGLTNHDYCKWCYAEGDYTLDAWKKYVDLGGKDAFEQFKRQLVQEFNVLLRAEGLPTVENLNVLACEFVNLEYTLPNGQKTKFLKDNATYLGTQLETNFGRCFGLAGGLDFLLVCSYDENGENPEIVVFKHR